jgi:hypothetical protein
MNFLLIIITAYLVAAVVALALFMFDEPSRFALDFRIVRTTYANGETDYSVQQRVPLVFVWLTCYRMAGVQYYERIEFKTEAEAREYLVKVGEAHERQRGWDITNRDNI